MSLVLTAFLLSFLAGIATALGSSIAFFLKKPADRVLALTLGLSAGVMIAISFIELLHKSIISIGFSNANLAFFAGIILIFLIDVAIPHEYKAESIKDTRLRRTGIFVAWGLAIHNFPEGFAVFAGSMQSVQLGALLAVAIAIHNIPEGISVAVPIFYSTGNRKMAFKYSFLSGMSEPVGALLGAFILLPFLTDFVVSLSLAFVAGVMVYISLDEILPAASKYGEEHAVALGVILGMAIMILSLYLFY